MQLRVFLGPFLMAAVCGLWIAALAYGREALRSLSGRWLCWFLLSSTGLVLWLTARGLGPAEWISGTSLSRALGAALLVGAAAAAFRASRLWRRAEVMLSSVPRTVDEAIASLLGGEGPKLGVYRGRLGAEARVISPGGVACAFYEAEVREVAEGGGRGRLLSVERASPRLLYLEGERRWAALAFDGSAVGAPVRIHRCRPPAGPGHVLSYERVGKVGEACLVVGRLQPGPASGSYILVGAGASALLVLADSALEPGRALARRAWGLFSLSATLCVAAALLLGHA